MMNSLDWNNTVAEIAAKKWPNFPDMAKPSPEGQSGFNGFLFSGIAQEVVSTQLLLDSRLTPLERNAWLVFKMLLDKQGFAVPRYKDLQPYLSMVPYGELASKETIARVITVLRLTRWLSLLTQSRDSATGRIQGSMYILHDEPISIAEAAQIDLTYKDLIAKSITHANKSVRIVAQHAVSDLEQAGEESPSRLDVLKERIEHQNNPIHTLGSDSEPGKNHRVRNQKPLSSDSEQSKNNQVRNKNKPGPESEPRFKPNDINRVRIPNPCTSTVLSTYICTVLYLDEAGKTHEHELQWPNTLSEFFNPHERDQAIAQLNNLNPLIQQQILHELASRCETGEIRNPSSYLFGLVRKAERGEFKAWAAHAAPSNFHAEPKSSYKHAQAPTTQVQRVTPETLSAEAAASREDIQNLLKSFRGNRPPTISEAF
ncbi:MAG: STY4528 family pathogenicity island replication protein [Pseudomonas sp.]|nr:STY4528 family pathogenicity island replication protein [Pseudomonas sp.]